MRIESRIAVRTLFLCCCEFALENDNAVVVLFVRHLKLVERVAVLHQVLRCRSEILCELLYALRLRDRDVSVAK